LMASMPSLNTFAGIGLATVPSLWSGDQLPVTTVAPPRSRLRYREAVCIATPRRLNGQANSSHQDVDAKGARQVRASDVRRFALSTSVAAASSIPPHRGAVEVLKLALVSASSSFDFAQDDKLRVLRLRRYAPSLRMTDCGPSTSLRMTNCGSFDFAQDEMKF
jgi:hypothetical protein